MRILILIGIAETTKLPVRFESTSRALSVTMKNLWLRCEKRMPRGFAS